MDFIDRISSFNVAVRVNCTIFRDCIGISRNSFGYSVNWETGRVGDDCGDFSQPLLVNFIDNSLVYLRVTFEEEVQEDCSDVMIDEEAFADLVPRVIAEP